MDNPTTGKKHKNYIIMSQKMRDRIDVLFNKSNCKISNIIYFRKKKKTILKNSNFKIKLGL
jgi:hypothetical protein